MAVVIKQQKSIAKVGSAQLEYVIQERQLLNVLDYVLANSYEQKINNDSRAVAYQRLEDAKKATESNDLREDFCSKFGSKSFGLVSEDDPLCSKKTKASNTASGTVAGTSIATKRGIYDFSKTPYSLKIQDRTYTITIWPSNAYPNLNTLNKLALKGYLRYLGLSKDNALQLAGVIRDWVDKDDFTEEEGGAEWSAYSQNAQPYKPRNAPIKNWQELNFLQRVDPDLIALLRQHFVLQGPEKVNADYVNNAQIAALAGVEQALVEKWRLQRSKETAESGKLDSKDQQKIDNVVGDKFEIEDVVIKINTGKSQLTAWFNKKNKKLQDWNITQDLPAMPLS